MVKKIRLQTHDGSKKYLEEIEGRPNQYKLVCTVDFLRDGSLPDGKEFIDPSGGPMIIVGNPLEDYDSITHIVKSISHEKSIGTVITLDP